MLVASLFTVKDGLVFIEALPVDSGMGARGEDWNQHVFADVNGDDWFYFEDETSSSSSPPPRSSSSSRKGQCANSMSADTLVARTISGSDTTLINFRYNSTPRHRVLHEGRCNFAGLSPVSSSSQADPDSRKFRFRAQEMEI